MGSILCWLTTPWNKAFPGTWLIYQWHFTGENWLFYSLQESTTKRILISVGIFVYSSFLVLRFPLGWTHACLLHANSLCECICASVLLCLKTLSPRLIIFPSHLSYTSVSIVESDLKTSHIVTNASKSLTLC